MYRSTNLFKGEYIFLMINSHNQHGFTLFETVIAIIIGLVVLGGGGALILSSTNNNKIQQAQQEVGIIILNLKSFYSGSHIPSDTTWDKYKGTGIYPPGVVNQATGYPENPWGGGFYLYGESSLNAVYIYFNALGSMTSEINQAVCIKLGQAFKRGYPLGEMQINTTNWDLETTVPTVEQIQAACLATNTNIVRLRLDL